jgi:hypothetical protein
MKTRDPPPKSKKGANDRNKFILPSLTIKTECLQWQVTEWQDPIHPQGASRLKIQATRKLWWGPPAPQPWSADHPFWITSCHRGQASGPNLAAADLQREEAPAGTPETEATCLQV